jgi:hypothetical protein
MKEFGTGLGSRDFFLGKEKIREGLEKIEKTAK